MKTLRVKGSELRVGDVLHVWWNRKEMASPNCDPIIGLRPYKGPLENLWPEGAQIASFTHNKVGMTIENNNYYEVDRP